MTECEVQKTEEKILSKGEDRSPSPAYPNPVDKFLSDIYRAIDSLIKTKSKAGDKLEEDLTEEIPTLVELSVPTPLGLSSQIEAVLDDIPENVISANKTDYDELLRLLHKFNLLGNQNQNNLTKSMYDPLLNPTTQ